MILLPTETPFVVVAARLLAALLLGGMLGLEREVREKPAGLRTHMLVSLASAAFTLQTIEISQSAVWRSTTDVEHDPMRLVQAIVAGVAFLGAGAIIQSGGSVRGLTTGAGIWTAGSVGIACGMGQLDLAALIAVLTVAVVWVVGAVERALIRRDPR